MCILQISLSIEPLGTNFEKIHFPRSEGYQPVYSRTPTTGVPAVFMESCQSHLTNTFVSSEAGMPIVLRAYRFIRHILLVYSTNSRSRQQDVLKFGVPYQLHIELLITLPLTQSIYQAFHSASSKERSLLEGLLEG